MFILAKYPAKDVSDNPSTAIYAWRYTGGIKGLLKSFITSLKMIKKNKLKLHHLFLFMYYLAGSWEQTNTVIRLDNANKACMTAEIYPNENKGRIVLSTVHAEYMIWRGGYIQEVENTDFNCIGFGFHEWKNINSFTDTLQQEFTYNWWILRRLVAWAAKIPNSHLPPIKDKIHNKQNIQILQNKIFWDNTLLSQMKDI